MNLPVVIKAEYVNGGTAIMTAETWPQVTRFLRDDVPTDHVPVRVTIEESDD